MAKKNTNAQVLAQVRMANGAVVDIYDIDLARQMGLLPAQAPKAGKGGRKSQPKAEKAPKVNPFVKGADGVSKFHKDMGLKTPAQVDADKQAYEQRISKQAYEFAVREKAGALKFSSSAAKKAFIAEAIAKDFKQDGDKLQGYDAAEPAIHLEIRQA